MQPFIGQGNQLAAQNDREGAIQRYQAALELDPQLDLNPEDQFQNIQQQTAAQNLISEIQSLAQSGDLTQALAKFQTLENTYPKAVDAETLNVLCWDGALNNQASQVLPLCDRAVTLAPEDTDIEDSRGLARALTGDFAGAITDFQAFVDSSDQIEESKAKRRAWIEALKAGKNPFTPEVLEALKGP